MISRTYSLSRRRFFPIIFGVFLALAIFGYFQITGRLSAPSIDSKDFATLSTLAGGIFGFMYFLYKQHDQDTDVFLRLFSQLNLRYDQLNEKLSEIVEAGDQAPLTKMERDVLCDYFNLCAEQYMYCTAGYIDKEVWKAWVAGMFFYYSIPKIRRYWDQELMQDSYYGFNPKVIFKNKLKNL